MKGKPDIKVRGVGTLWQFTPTNEAAYKTMDENVASEGWQWLGWTLCIDRRFGRGLVDHLESLGLVVVEVE